MFMVEVFDHEDQVRGALPQHGPHMQIYNVFNTIFTFGNRARKEMVTRDHRVALEHWSALCAVTISF